MTHSFKNGPRGKPKKRTFAGGTAEDDDEVNVDADDLIGNGTSNQKQKEVADAIKQHR